MKPASERFIQIVDALNLKNKDVAEATVYKIFPNQISQVRKDVTDVSINLVGALCEVCPAVNANYIIHGRGEMFIHENAAPTDLPIMSGEEREIFKNIIADRDKKISELEIEIKKLQTLLDRKRLDAQNK